MGDRLTDENEPQTAPRSYGDILDDFFPYYLVMGMTPEQYWDGESGLKKAFRKAYRLRKKTEALEDDQRLWLQGVYIRDAIASSIFLVAGFIPKGAHPGHYPDKPRMMTYQGIKNQETQKKAEENQMKLAMAMMQARITKFNKNFEKRKQQALPAETGGK